MSSSNAGGFNAGSFYEMKRGRPRKDDVQDDPLLERRRDQIRRAVRAHRQRARDTTKELRARISALTTTVQALEKTWTEFVTRMSRETLTSAQSEVLQKTGCIFEAVCSHERNIPREKTGQRHNELGARHRRPIIVESQEAILQINDARAASLGAHSIRSSSKLEQAENISYRVAPTQSLPRTVLLGSNADDATGELDEALKHLSHSFESTTVGNDNGTSSYKEKDANVSCFCLDVTSEEPEADILAISDILDDFAQPPKLVQQEKTFGRRLHRATTQAAYDLVQNAHRRPSRFERVFKLPLTFRSEATIRRRLVNILNRGVTEELENPCVTSLHVGGAGTHYPRIGADGIPRPRHKVARSSGMFGVGGHAQEYQNRGTSPPRSAITIQIESYEGIWFDAYDVEGYLAERGLHIPASSVFVKCEIIQWHTRSIAGLNNVENAASALQEGYFNSVTEHDARVCGIGFSDIVMSSLLPHHWLGPQPEHLAASVSIATLDVARLIQVLIGFTVCLGHSAGLRKSDVDRALALSCCKES